MEASAHAWYLRLPYLPYLFDPSKFMPSEKSPGDNSGRVVSTEFTSSTMADWPILEDSLDQVAQSQSYGPDLW